MGKQPQTTATLPLIPLPRGSVLLPGLVQRVDVTSSRPDLPALLAHVYERAAAQGSAVAIDSIPIACVPLSSKPILGPDDQPNLIESADNPDDTASSSRHELDSARPDPPPLFGFGVAAKIVGIDGRGAGEFSLRVEGTARLRFDALSRRRPFLQGKVTHLRESVDLDDTELQRLFSLLRSRSRELVTILRISSLLPRAKDAAPPALPPLLTKRLELFIMARQVEDAGLLADFMTNLVEASHDEKLAVLAALDLKVRIATVIQLLERQVGGIKNNFKIATFATLPFHIIHPSPDHAAGRALSSLPLTAIRLGPHSNPHSFPSAQAPDEDHEPNELDQVRQKLEAAKLPPDASRAAHRELRRLQNMMPMNQEYHVTRNWLETMADLPWASYTDDRLGPETLARARKQLDDDHYGLDKVKRRLIEYLAVLRLKRSLQDSVQSSKAETEHPSNHLDPVTDAAASLDAGHDAQNTNSRSHPSSSDVPGRQQSERLPDHGRPEDEDGSIQPRPQSLSPSQPLVDRSPIMLLVGPPGVGKTSLAKSVAAALGRKFHRISLGGIRDEAEIRGHRRTYVAAMPGLIVQGLRKVAVANPVFLLDEIDKIGMASLHGDPSAAMLEVLDPEQNFCFQDHYLGVPIDLSHVLFIATANSLDPIPAPLLDRMETIQLTGYTPLEKGQIAIRHLVPKQMRVNGLADGQVILGQDVVSKLIQSYTREAGVRNLEREIGSVFRAKAVEFSEARDGQRLDEYRRQVRVADLETILGTEKYDDEMAEKESRPGVVTGLVAYSTGGDGSILFIEMADMPGKGGRLQLTGKLGDVLKESVEVALSWVKAHAFELGLTEEPRGDLMKDRSIHVHCPSGAVPKDGPSSGIGQAIALISLFSGRPVPPTMAMTGEISLRGRVTAVGGIKEKLIGALRAGVKSVLLPAQNRKETKDLPQEVKDGLRIEYISHIWEAIRLVWPDSHWAADGPSSGIESRL